jgi:hypothetical protein
MTIYELHLAFNDGLDNVSSSSYPQFPPEQRDRFLNLGAERFIKQRYGGNNFNKTSFEETQKRTDDLSNLVFYVSIPPLQNGFYQNIANVQTTYYALPDDYWFALTERINGVDNCGNFNSGVKSIRHDELNVYLRDPFNRPEKRKRILRLFCSGLNANSPNNLIQVFHKDLEEIGNYELAYIANFVRLRGQFYPDQVPIQGLPFTYQAVNPQAPNFWMDIQYWFNIQCHQEIVDLAVKAALETIEHPRYQTFQNEFIMQE